MNNAILYLETGTFGGGSFTALLQHVIIMQKRGYHAHIACFNRTRYVELLQRAGADVYILSDPLLSVNTNAVVRLGAKSLNWPFAKGWLRSGYVAAARLVHQPSIARLRELIREHDIAVVHLNTGVVRDRLGAIAAADTRTPCISHLRSISEVSGNRLNPSLAAFLEIHVDRFVAVSAATAGFWSRAGLPAKSISVCYDSHSEDHVASEPAHIRCRWNVPADVKFVVGCVGNFVPAKGHNFLLRAFQELNERRPGDYILMLVGHGYLEADIRRTVSDLGIEDLVRFAGYQTNAPAIIAEFDALVVSSMHEGLPRVIMEAMLVNTPVVSTAVGGIPELIVDGVTGTLVEYGDTAGMATSIDQSCRDSTTRERLLDSAKQLARDLLDAERYGREMDNFYLAAMARIGDKR